MEAEPLLTLGQAARRLQISVRQLHRLISGGQIRTIRLSERVVRIAPQDLAAFVEAKREQT